MDMVYFFGAETPRIFGQCVTFHPNHLVHLRHSQLSPGA